MYKIAFTVPVEHSEKVKNAAFDAGGGHQDNYAKCAFTVIGTGQFMPLDNSKPFIGQENTLEYIQEARIEIICPEDKVVLVKNAICKNHPYESPAIDIYKLFNENFI